VRWTAHAELGQALLKIHSGNATAAGKTAETDEILNSDMPTQDKGTVCASTVSTPQGPRTAAQFAMQNGHPLAAAAMMLAILECRLGPDEKLELMAMLGVSNVEVDAERMWTKGSGQVLCSAEEEIPQLRFQRVDEPDLEAEGQLCYAVEPGWLVKHPASTSLVQGDSWPPVL
jgi:hypothetical protein